MISNARSLGKLAGIMANKGVFDGQKLMNQETWEAIHADPKEGRMNGFYMTYFTKGGMNAYAHKPITYDPKDKKTPMLQ